MLFISHASFNKKYINKSIKLFIFYGSFHYRVIDLTLMTIYLKKITKIDRPITEL